MAYYRDELDEMTCMLCAEEGCEHGDGYIFVRAKCHPKAGMIGFYDKTNKTLTLACSVCEKFVADFVVAGKPN